MKKTEEKDLILANGATQIVSASQLDGIIITKDIIKGDNFTTSYENLNSLINYLTTVKKAIDEEIKEVIQKDYIETGEASVKATGYTFTYVSPSTKESFDSKRFKVEHPDLYKQYTKISNVSDSLRVSKKDKKEVSEEKRESIEADFSEVK